MYAQMKNKIAGTARIENSRPIDTAGFRREGSTKLANCTVSFASKGEAII
jgi:hypothetical protein